MTEKKLILNCEVCDSTKMKEEDYRHYGKITINTEVLVVNAASKSMLNRLPVGMNVELMIESEEDIDVKVINSSYEITTGMPPQKPVILIANGFLKVWPGTEEVLKKYECIIINGVAELPESLKNSLDKIVVNGPMRTYPDNCVILEDDFVMDSYFPIRAGEGMKYFARKIVIIQDTGVDVSKLVQKNVQILTPRVIVPEGRLEESAVLFDAGVDFVVVPEGLSLVYGNAVLDEELLGQKGRKIFVYGNLKLAEQMDMEILQRELDKLVVTGSVNLYKEQRERGFKKSMHSIRRFRC